MNEIAAYSHVKTNQTVMDLLSREEWDGKTILDAGAGEGFFSRQFGERLRNQFNLDPREHLFACDLDPGNFKYDGIECRFADLHAPLPYGDERFDWVVSIEVIEHLENIFAYLRELKRITKPGGRIVITTPNILNVNSRIRYFASGFWLLFGPLPLDTNRPTHTTGHIQPVGLYYLAYALYRCGFGNISFHYDRMKKSSLFLSAFVLPVITILNAKYRARLRRKNPDLYEQNKTILDSINSLKTLTARTIVLTARK